MWAVIIHGGAGAVGREPRATVEPVLDAILAAAEAALIGDAAALDVVEGAVRGMEDSGLFVAGKGARPNRAGQYELDASIMDGSSRRTGAVAALAGAYPPIAIARAVMERTGHVLLAGEGARAFALAQGFTAIANPDAFFAPRLGAAGPAPGHGTVGAVALDTRGRIAAATSTGGTERKLPGRVGDSPIVGAGTWADGRTGVSCTGKGEFFIRTAAAHQVAMRLGLGGAALREAVEATLADIAGLDGEGGIIALDAAGAAHYAFNTKAMRVALATSGGRREVRLALA